MPGVDPYTNDLRLYLEAHCEADDALLEQLTRDTHRLTVHPRMLGGPLLGGLLDTLVAIKHPLRLLEIGTFTGYSTLRMARAAGDACRVDTVERDARHAAIAQRYFSLAQMEARITLHLGDARDVLGRLESKYDFVLVDGDKREYPSYLELLLPLMAKGCVMVADNALWGGKVLDESQRDAFTEGVRTFCRQVRASGQFTSTILPTHDGVLLACRR